MESRTFKQFEVILESFINGNLQQAGDQAVEYGFFAVDLKNAYYNDCGVDAIDIALIAESAMKIRNL